MITIICYNHRELVTLFFIKRKEDEYVYHFNSFALLFIYYDLL